MKKFFISLLTLCLSLCAFTFSACEEPVTPSTPETPPAENPQPEEETPPAEEETEEVEEPQTTVTTEFAMFAFDPTLLTTEYHGNQLQREAYISPFGGGTFLCFEYDYDEQDVLKTATWNDLEHFYITDSLPLTLEERENGIFTGASEDNDVRIIIETHANGIIKTREWTIENPFDGRYTIGAEFDEQGRRTLDYIALRDFYNLNSEYTYESDNKFSSSCTMTTAENGEETSLGCTITRENELLTNVYIASAEINCELNYLPNGNFTGSIVTHYNNGVVHSKSTLTLDYNDTDLVAQAVEKRYNENNQLAYEHTYNYNEKGLETNSEQITYNADGSGYKSTKAYEYNSNNERIKSTSQTMEYINNAFVLKGTTVTEYTADGSISTTTHYNTDGSYYVEVSEYENAGCKTTTMHYDANGFLYTKGTQEYKYVSLGNGVRGAVTVKSTITHYLTNNVVLVFESEYNDDEKITKATETKYTDGDIEYILTKTYEYDSDGYLLVCRCVRQDGFGNIIEEWEE